MTPIRFTDLIQVDAGFKPSVQLPVDFEHAEMNARLIKTYIPTNQTIALFTEIARSLNPSSTERARTLVGTYGTGKSDFLLMLCNYFSRSVDDPVMQPFYTKLCAIDQDQYTTIREQRANKPPFLVVLLQADAVTPFPGFVLHGLHTALKRIGQDHLMSTTKYKAAQQQIATWKHTAHPRLDDFRRILQEHEGKELVRLLDELDSAQADLAFLVFERTFTAVTGSEFNVYGYSQPHETYLTVARKLKDHQTHSGILLVCDEFTEFLRRFAQAIDQGASAIDSQTKAVDNLAERSASSGDSQIHFIVASLESFASASVEGGTAQASKAVERIGGRFKHHSLDSQGSEELIRGAIRRLPAATTFLPNPQQDTLMDVAVPIWKRRGYTKEWVKSVVVEGTFPLHPLTTYTLPLINRQVAQSQRTMFLFLNDERGLRGFLQREELVSKFPDWHTLLTLDLLFDYFQDSIETKKPDLAEVYQHSLQRLHNATVDTTIAQRILKIVAVCEVVQDLNLRPTRSFLRQALNVPLTAENDLTTALSMLEQTEALHPPGEAESEDTGIYSLPMPGRISTVNLRQRIKQRAKELPTSVERLQSRYPAANIDAIKYNQTRGSYRQVSAFYVSRDQLHSVHRLKTDLSNVRDALLWYIVVTSDVDRAEAQSKARELTKQYPQLIMAVPTTALPILSALRNYEALEAMRKDPELDEAAQRYLRDSGPVGKEYKMALDHALTTVRNVKEWEWFLDGVGRPGITNEAQLRETINRLIEMLFPGTPAQSLGQQFKAEGISNSLEKAVTELLKGTVQISGSSAVDTILRKGVSSLGLLKLHGKTGGFDIYVLTDPDGANYESKKIWQFFQQHLAAQKPWAKLVVMLRNQPYGLYDSLLFVYLAAFLVHYAESVEVLANVSGGRQSLPIDVKLLKRMLEHPKDYTIRYQPLTAAEQRWLRGMVEHGLQRKLDYNASSGTTLRATVAEQIQAWVKRIGFPLFAENLTEEQLQYFLPDSDPIITQTSILLMCAHRDKHTFASQILQDIPARLQAPDDRSVWTDETVAELLALFTEVCRTLEQLPQMLKAQAIARIAVVFGADQSSAEASWNSIYQWRRSREVVKPDGLQTMTRALFRLTNESTGSIEHTLLDEFAAQVVGIGTHYQNWREYDRLDKLVLVVERAKQEIDTSWKRAAPVEEVWFNGLATITLGRDVHKATAPQVAQHLAHWAASRSSPACVTTLTTAQVQNLYSAATLEQCHDITYLLQRTSYQAQQWELDIIEGLAKQFGLHSWRKQEVQDALSRFEIALRDATNIDTLLRQHVLTRLTGLFSNTPILTETEDNLSFSNILISWCNAHPIPAQHDLTSIAGIVLHHVTAGISTPETTLLTTLPRALPGIDQSYQQWSDYTIVERYLAMVAQAIEEINTYVPLTEAEYQWLTGLVKQGLRQPVLSNAREQTQLVQSVHQQLTTWLQGLQLPVFCATLSGHDFRHLFPEAADPILTASNLLINHAATPTETVASLLLTTLPTSLGIIKPSQQWDANDTANLIAQFKQVCQVLAELNSVLAQQVYTAIGAIVGVEDPAVAPRELLAHFHTWHHAHVLLPGEQLSSHADILFQVLQQPSADPTVLFLDQLPQRLSDIQVAYGQWKTWQTRHTYVDALREAVQEIEDKGRVHDATPRAQELWKAFQQNINELTPDEQRWLIKMFNEAFQL